MRVSLYISLLVVGILCSCATIHKVNTALDDSHKTFKKTENVLDNANDVLVKIPTFVDDLHETVESTQQALTNTDKNFTTLTSESVKTMQELRVTLVELRKAATQIRDVGAAIKGQSPEGTMLWWAKDLKWIFTLLFAITSSWLARMLYVTLKSNESLDKNTRRKMGQRQKEISPMSQKSIDVLLKMLRRFVSR